MFQFLFGKVLILSILHRLLKYLGCSDKADAERRITSSGLTSTIKGLCGIIRLPTNSRYSV